MIWKKVVDGELFVFWKGQIIYKRWISKGYGMVFDPYGWPFVPRERDR